MSLGAIAGAPVAARVCDHRQQLRRICGPQRCPYSRRSHRSSCDPCVTRDFTPSQQASASKGEEGQRAEVRNRRSVAITLLRDEPHSKLAAGSYAVTATKERREAIRPPDAQLSTLNSQPPTTRADSRTGLQAEGIAARTSGSGRGRRRKRTAESHRPPERTEHSSPRRDDGSPSAGRSR